MTITTAKGSHTAPTFAMLASWQATMQGAFASIEIGRLTIDVDDTSEDNAEDYAARVESDPDVIAALEALRTEAAAAGDTAQVALCDAALARRNTSALEDCIAALCDAAAQD